MRLSVNDGSGQNPIGHRPWLTTLPQPYHPHEHFALNNIRYPYLNTVSDGSLSVDRTKIMMLGPAVGAESAQKQVPSP